MAEIVLKFVLGKLAESLIEEAHFFHGVADKAESLTHELKWIEALLEDADSKCNKDARVKQWVKDVKEVAYMTEDALDTYLVEMKVISKHTFRRIPKKIIAKHKFGSQIDKIRARISEIKDFRTNYGISELKASTGDSGVSTQQQLMGQLVNPEINEEVVVGLKDAVEDVIKKLTDESISSRFVLSIVGQPGLGKTTLAKEVFTSENVQSHFDHRIWLSISAEFDLTKVLKTIIQKVSNVDSKSLRKKGPEDLTALLHDSLKNKKCLIVLDDIWKNKSDFLLEAIQKGLSESNNGSRVLITTRFVDVAKNIDLPYDTYELALLNEQESQELLLKKACPHCDCPDDLLPLAQKLSEKCAGLPLALVVLSGQLSMTDLNFHSWNKVMQILNWNDEDKDTMCMDAISASYQVLSPHLKQCFIYLALYPEDYKFRSKDITRLWIAEGFITHNHSSSKKIEDTADEYLKELAQRCLVQVSKKTRVGNIKYCQLHDLIREFVIRKAREENILMVLSEIETSYSSNDLERRVAFLSENVQTENISTNIRSLLAFGRIAIRNYSSFKLLRVLDLEDGSGILDDGRCLAGLTNLRYLNCNAAKINASCLTCFDSLQTVNLFLDNECSLPETFWDSKLLQHVIFEGLESPKGPPSSAELKNLLTLRLVWARREWSSKLPHFPRLRKLKILLPQEFEWEPFTQRLRCLEELEHLFVGTNFEVMVHITPAFANFKCLQWLCLHGQWPEEATIDFTMLPPNLVKLTLSNARLKKDPLPELEKLQHLQVLNLLDQPYIGRRMACSKGGFPSLQKMNISDCPELEEWNIEDGAMPNIKWLQLIRCTKFEMMLNLHHLTYLRYLTSKRMSFNKN